MTLKNLLRLREHFINLKANKKNFDDSHQRFLNKVDKMSKVKENLKPKKEKMADEKPEDKQEGGE